MADASVWQPGAASSLIQAVVNSLTSTSSTSLAVGSGIKTLTVGVNLLFIPGNWVLIVDAGNTNNYMLGQIISYDGSTGVLVVNVPATAFNGAGTKIAWTVTVSGLQGINGQLSGNVAGDINFQGLITMAQTLAVTGAVSFGNTVALAADPTAALQAATKQYVDALIPIGAVMDYSGAMVSLGSNWLLCNGQAVNRITYASLFTLYGTLYGAGDGVTTFNIPDLRRRVTMGAGGTGTATIGNALGNSGGEENHTLTVAEMPSHGHTEPLSNVITPVTEGGTGNILKSGSGSVTGNNGGGAAHNNIQPSMILNKVVRAL